MIKINNTIVSHGEQWKSLILGARNAMNSWDKSDSGWVDFEDWDCGHGIPDGVGNAFVVGPNDLDLMQRLVKAGTDHRKFMRMIVVYVDITAPLYWWKEADTYSVGVVKNSCSTMHKIHTKTFEASDFSCENMDADTFNVFTDILEVLEEKRYEYCVGKDKNKWYSIIQLLPSSYNQKRTVMLNYEVLRNMYHSRKNHKLYEWRELCSWIEQLPYAKELICNE